MIETNKRIFSKLPRTTLISTKKGFENFSQTIDKLYDADKEQQLSNIAKTIYNKLTSDNPEESWTLSSYSDFKKYFVSISIKEIDNLGTSIQKCLDTKKSEIYECLEKFSQECNWYNVMINKKEATNQKRGIKETDCFYIMTLLLSQMYKEIHVYATLFIDEFNNENSIVEITEKFKNDTKVKNNLQKNFEEKFMYLTNYELFVDLYFNMKNKSFREAEEMIRQRCGHRKVIEDYRKLNNGEALPHAQYCGKCQLNHDIKHGNRNREYIRKR